jgi:hypothetical protein
MFKSTFLVWKQSIFLVWASQIFFANINRQALAADYLYFFFFQLFLLHTVLYSLYFATEILSQIFCSWLILLQKKLANDKKKLFDAQIILQTWVEISLLNKSMQRGNTCAITVCCALTGDAGTQPLAWLDNAPTMLAVAIRRRLSKLVLQVCSKTFNLLNEFCAIT